MAIKNNIQAVLKSEIEGSKTENRFVIILCDFFCLQFFFLHLKVLEC